MVKVIAVPGSPVRFSTVPRTPDVMSSARYPDEMIPEKPGTDVLLIGTAYPPRGKRVTERVVSLRVETGEATLHKAVKVFGQRVWIKKGKRIVPGPAGQLEPTPLSRPREESTEGPEITPRILQELRALGYAPE